METKARKSFRTKFISPHNPNLYYPTNKFQKTVPCPRYKAQSIPRAFFNLQEKIINLITTLYIAF